LNRDREEKIYRKREMENDRNRDREEKRYIKREMENNRNREREKGKEKDNKIEK
jgi:hypothetical protein